MNINSATLQFYRKAKDMTQEALAKKIGCSKDTLSRWERGAIVSIRPRLQGKLSEALEVEWQMLCRPYEEAQSRAATEKPKLRLSINESDGGDSLFGPGEHKRQLNVRLTATEHIAFATISLR